MNSFNRKIIINTNVLLLTARISRTNSFSRSLTTQHAEYKLNTWIIIISLLVKYLITNKITRTFLILYTNQVSKSIWLIMLRYGPNSYITLSCTPFLVIFRILLSHWKSIRISFDLNKKDYSSLFWEYLPGSKFFPIMGIIFFAKIIWLGLHLFKNCIII